MTQGVSTARKSVFANLQFGCTEVNEQAMLHPHRSEIAEQLSHVLVNQRPAGLQLDDQASIGDEIGVKFAQYGTILVEDAQWMLLIHLNALLAQAMSKSILVDFFEVAMAEMAMQRETGFANQVA